MRAQPSCERLEGEIVAAASGVFTVASGETDLGEPVPAIGMLWSSSWGMWPPVVSLCFVPPALNTKGPIGAGHFSQGHAISSNSSIASHSSAFS